MSLFKIPISGAKKIISIQKKLFGGRVSENRYLVTVCSENVEAPKHLGGLGFGSLRLKNLGLLLKWWTRYYNIEHTLWKKVKRSLHKLLNKILSYSDLQQAQHGPFEALSKVRTLV